MLPQGICCKEKPCIVSEAILAEVWILSKPILQH